MPKRIGCCFIVSPFVPYFRCAAPDPSVFPTDARLRQYGCALDALKATEHLATLSPIVTRWRAFLALLLALAGLGSPTDAGAADAEPRVLDVGSAERLLVLA